MTFVVYPNYWVHGGIIGIIMAGYIAGRQWLKQAVEMESSLRSSVLQDF